VADRGEATQFGSVGERPPGASGRSRSDVSERGWVSIENAIEVSRSPEDVFDYLTDITKEFEWNPRTRRAEKLTPGPIGPGTRFGAEWIKGNPTIVEYVRFEPPMAWVSAARSRRLDAKSEGQISPTEQGSRVVVRTKLRPKGFLALLLPLMRRMMQGREDQNLERVKAILEGTG
jgi:Polyketide cyclase / dehydrase and lipid transport